MKLHSLSGAGISLAAALPWVIGVAAIPAQGPPTLVKDLNIATASGALTLVPPSEGVQVVGVATFFVATDPMHGTELWRTDGTTAGTRLVKDMALGSASSSPNQLVAMNNLVFFTADDGVRGRELWRSDGTAAGTVLVSDIIPGNASSTPSSLLVIDTTGTDRLFFSADNGTQGRELHYTTGSNAVLVIDAFPGSGSGMTMTAPLVRRKDPTVSDFAGVYFAATNGTAGEELWQYGSNGARMCVEIRPGASGSSPRDLAAPTEGSGQLIAFSATDGTHGREIWHAYPSATGADSTTMLSDFNAGAASSDPLDFQWVATDQYVCSIVHPSLGREPAKYTVTGSTFTVSDLNVGSADSSPTFLGRRHMAATTATTGRELWRRPLSGQPILQMDINPGAASSSPGAGFGIYGNGSVHFSATDPLRGRELWYANSTGGLTPMPEIRPGTANSDPVPLARVSIRDILITANDGVHGPEPWIATESSVSLLRDINAPLTHGNPREFAALGDLSTILFQGSDGVNGVELWRSNGTAAGTTLVKDINPGTADSLPTTLTAWNGKVYFVADNGTHGNELWSSDGTNAGTVLVKDIQPGSSGLIGQELAVFGGFLWFAASDGPGGTQLWRSDGTAAGTVLVKVINPAGNALPKGFTVLGSTLFFSAFTAAQGVELWKTDGTAGGTVLVKDINPGTTGSIASPLGHPKAVSGTKLLFGANNGVSGEELWQSDGTTAGTTLVSDINPGAVSSSPTELTVRGNNVYFAATTAALGRELWSFNGILNAAILVRDISVGATSSTPRSLTAFGSTLLFHAETPSAGRELWKSDGTSAGTVLVKDIYAGAQDGVVDGNNPNLRPAPMFTLPGAQRVLFVASNGIGGAEIWRTDGTAAGTVQHTEIAPDAAGSQREYYGRFGVAGASIFFAANNGVIGYELYSMPAMASFALYAQGCAGTGNLVPQIDGAGTPSLGSRSFAITCGNALPNTAAILQLGFAPLDLPLGNGCRVLFDLTGPFASVPGATNTRGDASFPLLIPSDRNLEGLQLFAQTLVVDPQGAYLRTLAFSDGLRVVIAGD